MKTIPFSKEIHNKLISTGYTHLEISEGVNDEFITDAEPQPVHTFTPLRQIDTVTAESRVVPIYSTIIDKMLADNRLKCFIVVDELDI